MQNPPISTKFFLLTITITLLWFAEPSFAGLFKYVDDAGKTHYTDDKGKIPLKYRTKTHLKKLRPLNESSAKSEKNGKKTELDNSSAAINEKGIVSDKEEETMNKIISFFKSENTRSAKYKGLQNISPTYRKMSIELENNLPAKKKLIDELAKSEHPTLKETYGFLNKSAAADELRLKTVWQQGTTGSYYNRILGEIDVKNGLIVKLKKSLEASNKLKEAKENLAKEKTEKKNPEKEKEVKKYK
jgi:uncharacterized protein HemY